MSTQATSSVRPAVRKASARIPGPPAWPVLGNVRELGQGAFHEVLLRLHQRYGDIFRLRYPGGGDVVVVRDPDALRHILQTHYTRYRKGRQLEVARPLIGQGIFISEGEFWLRQRRLVQPAFVRPAVRALAPRMAQVIDELLDAWEPAARTGEPIPVKAEMMRLAMQIVARTMFSNSLRPEELQEVEHHFTYLLTVVSHRSSSIVHNLFPWVQKLPTPANRRFQKAIRALDRIIFRLIEDRKRRGDEGQDVLGMLLRARHEETGQGMTDRQLRDEVVTLFLAGHETTAIALTWALALLSRFPWLRAELQAEADAVLGDERPTAAHYDRLTFTRAFFDEVLRLYPPQIVMLREAAQEDEIGGFALRPGQALLLHIYGVHMHEAYWDNPAGLDPKRFPPYGPGPKHKFAYLPFGAGPRRCLGDKFAHLEGTLALALIHRRYTLDLVPGTPLEPDTVGTLRPKGPVPMRVRRR